LERSTINNERKSIMNQPTTNLKLQKTPSAEDIQAWLVSQVAQQLAIAPEEIDINIPFEDYGLNSAQAMSITTQGEQLLGFQPAPVLLWHYPTINSLSQRLAEEFATSDSEMFEI
jgi:acyl carrier protein